MPCVKEDSEMAKRIITISREFGSGGRFIGEEVAKKLGIAYYDKNIISEIAEKSVFLPMITQGPFSARSKITFLCASYTISSTDFPVMSRPASA